jgi:hypothetical protein
MENTATRPTTLRARLIAEGAVPARPGLDPALDADDPFAGDDILWAEEDWPANWSADDGSWLMFSYGLTVAVLISALVWLLLAGSVFLVYRIAT